MSTYTCPELLRDSYKELWMVVPNHPEFLIEYWPYKIPEVPVLRSVVEHYLGPLEPVTVEYVSIPQDMEEGE